MAHLWPAVGGFFGNSRPAPKLPENLTPPPWLNVDMFGVTKVTIGDILPSSPVDILPQAWQLLSSLKWHLGWDAHYIG